MCDGKPNRHEGAPYADPNQSAATERTALKDAREMTGLLSFLATGVLLALACWLLAGVLLRVCGVLLFACGLLVTAATGAPAAALATILGVLAWLAGHWLFAARNHFFSSPLARRIFLEALPRPFDPTRRWGIPNVPPERR